MRYRDKDVRSLPELQNILMDYYLPIIESNTNDANIQNKSMSNKIPIELHSSQRPLVQILLIQENMSRISLDAVIIF